MVGVDGSKPGLVAVVLHLLRLPELATGVLLMFILLNDLRQRLGDWLAQTVVVRETPEQDDESGKTKAEEGK